MPAPPAPPPPPPPPMPGFGSAAPPPPPPPVGAPRPTDLPADPPSGISKDRGALLSDITKGTRLKKTITDDRSAPQVGKNNQSSAGPPIGGAPAIPGLGKPPSGLAPPVPGSRGRSNSDTGGGGSNSEVPVAPQLGGLLAGGIPKLRKTGIGIDTGAERDTSPASDPESSRRTPPKQPAFSAPKPPIAPRSSNKLSTPPSLNSSVPQPPNPIIAGLRKPPLKPVNRPSSTSDLPPRAPPPPPSAPKPAPPPTSRKPSAAPPPPPPPPPPPTAAPTPPSAPPPPPNAAPRLPPSTVLPPTAPPAPPTPPAPPPPPASSAPKTPPVRSTLPTTTPSVNQASEGISQSIAMQAARNAFKTESGPPAAPPPPPPPGPSPLKQSTVASPPPAPSAPPPSTAKSFQAPARSSLDPSSYTLANGVHSAHSSSSTGLQSSPNRAGSMRVEDSRFRFQDEVQLPKPREFMGGMKKYRAGRGSSVPLDLSQFR